MKNRFIVYIVIFLCAILYIFLVRTWLRTDSNDYIKTDNVESMNRIVVDTFKQIPK